MAINVNVSGARKNVRAVSVKVAGVWRNVVQAYVKVAGVWKELLQALMAPLYPSTQQQKLTVGGLASNQLGFATAVDGNTAAVSSYIERINGISNAGVVRIFTSTNGVWTEQQKLVASAASAELFGRSVSINGDTAVVGASGAVINGNSFVGAAYVFTRTDGVWTEQQKLVASDGATFDWFSDSVSISGDTAVIGAYAADPNGISAAGAAYVFTRTNGVWTEQQKLVASDGAADDQFGSEVSISGDTAVVGANLADPNGISDAGAAYVFTRTGSTWSEQQKLVASDGAIDDRFGYSVSIDGSTAVIGARQADPSGISNAGAAYVFTRTGSTWTEQQKLVASDGAASDNFGWSSGLSGDAVVVGAVGADINGISDAGAAYVFTRTGSTWTEQQKLTEEDTSGDQFGSEVSIDGDTAVIGAYRADPNGISDAGAAYVFTRTNGVWSEQQKLVASDGAADDWFGLSASINGDTAVIGARQADPNGISGAGAAYVFTRTNGVWTEQAKLVASDGAANDSFGRSVSISGDTAVVGAFQADPNGINAAGAAYVFTRTGSTWSEQAKLVASDGAADDWLGASVSISGDTAVVGANLADPNGISDAGAAYVFTRTNGVWTEQQKLVASDGAASDSFGFIVSIDGDTAVIGAYLVDPNGISSAGAAYVFTRTGSTWSEQAKLVASDAASSDYFGYSVSISGDTAVIGAYRADPNGISSAGAAYVFTRTNGVWRERRKLVASDGASSDLFGATVSINGDTAVIGAGSADPNGINAAGAAYIFIGIPWYEAEKLVASDAASSDLFGYSVSINGDTAVVGARQADPNGISNAGAAYVFTRTGSTWSEQQKLVASDGAGSDYFGESVSIDGDTAVVGAYLADPSGNSNSGAAYVFARTNGVWTEQQKLVASDGAGNALFGRSVSINGDTAVVGARQANPNGITGAGAAYVFTRTGSTWSEQQKLVASDGAGSDYFGESVSIDGDTAVVGAYLADPSGISGAGAAYVFTRTGSTWTEQQKLVASDGAADDWFGATVSINGDTAVVGARQADPNGISNAGAAYVFTRTNGVWSEQQKLVASDGASGDYFGYSVSISGDTAVIGAYRADPTGISDAGAAYVFTRTNGVWTERRKLVASDGASSDWFGATVSISSDTAVVGAYYADPNGINAAGAAYIFDSGAV